MKKNIKIIPVILSGGEGTRLWPLSRNNFPKQFLTLKESHKHSLFQQTQERIKGISNLDSPIIICNEEHRFIASEQLRQISVTARAILLEPFCRNTAPAVTIAALKALEKEIDPILLVLPSDHEIINEENFRKTIEIGSEYASKDRLTAFGIVPTYAETGYGYIESCREFDSELLEGHKIVRFIEKPNMEMANQFIKSKNFTWNSGMYIFKAKVFIDEIQKLQPELYVNCKNSVSKIVSDLDFQRIEPQSFKKCSNISLDVAVMEKTNLGTVIPLDAGWSDIGSWESLWKSEEKDEVGNVKSGKVFTSETKNSYLRSDHRLLVALGIENMIIVDTSDVVLIANKKCSQSIKKLVGKLKEKGLSANNLNRKVYRPWGNFVSIAEGEEWQVKRIEVNPEASLSLQMHNHRAEHWIVVNGIAGVEIDGKSSQLKKNESIFVPKKSKHRLFNPGKNSLIIIEVQSGNYLGEDDIMRFKDIYGRN